ncbi:MAG TPA: PfkB family carbohydrate kinase, partial [Terracidiphilus sp.]
SGVGEDERGERILDAMREIGLGTRYVTRVAGHATGVVTVTFVDGQPRYILHRPAAYDFPSLTEAQLEALRSQPVDWIYFGTLLQMSEDAKRLTRRLLDSIPQAKHFYDVNLRADNWEPALLRDSVARATVVKLNDEEVREVAQVLQQPAGSLEEFCRACAGKYALEAVCVTRGPRGCALLIHGDYLESPGYSIEVVDTVGAGDAFAAAFLHGWDSGWPPPRIADFANRVGALVASRPGAIPRWNPEEVEALGKSDRRERA